ncbi:hypothetical protein A6A04_11910 [Paramagnetospirillum marisnigri]|uniref:Uncharacterized protein n=1 Tax=Paramagnetospirillum marisnigri TaxID=1285242 RepID=A0A178MW19_9PROT|nr:hypothetical protein [Paramagnetospirillum marisnigri]OAN54626.1 hypothetical protein A6A04_11910 [Paramagnetospirillum marisnigri]
MVDTSRGIGLAPPSGGVSNVRETFSRNDRTARSTVAIGPGIEGTSPNGPRGRRMLAANTPIESLDRFAPRGTYLDLLI